MKKFKKVDLSKKQKELNKRVVKRLSLYGGTIVAEVIKRTQSGKDKDNKAFKPYSKAYRAEKSKGFGSKVNLTRTGNMLNSIDYKTITNGIRVFVANNEKKKALGNIKHGRKFMGIDSKLKKKIKKRIENG